MQLNDPIGGILSSPLWINKKLMAPLILLMVEHANEWESSYMSWTLYQRTARLTDCDSISIMYHESMLYSGQFKEHSAFFILGWHDKMKTLCIALSSSLIFTNYKQTMTKVF